jgi:deglycase
MVSHAVDQQKKYPPRLAAKDCRSENRAWLREVASRLLCGCAVEKFGVGLLSGCCFTRTMSKTLLAFVDDIYEDLELWYPKLRLEEAGFAVRLGGKEMRTFKGKHGYPATADILISDCRSADFTGLLIPGGFMPDKLRRDAKVLSLTREFFDQGKLVAFICHGGWIPISAKILKGRRATGSLGIKDDLENAGAIWVDEPVVVDGNLVSGRTPVDLPWFARAMTEFLATHEKVRNPAPEKPLAPRDEERRAFGLKKVMLKDILK